MTKMNFVDVSIDHIIVVLEKSVLVSKNDEEHWIARSNLSMSTDDQLNIGDRDVDIENIQVVDWIAKQQGW